MSDVYSSDMHTSDAQPMDECQTNNVSRTLRPVRVGHIEFLNCYPLYYGLGKRSSTTTPFELQAGVPTDLNRMLVAGTIDFGPISSIAYALNHRLLALSRRLSISSRGAVDSIQLVCRRPLEELETIALTPQSATSVVLLKTLLRLRYRREVHYSEMRGSPEEELNRCDAVLLIGDQGLEAMYFPLEETIRYDLGVLWNAWTGLPMVYAVWAARADFLRRRSGDLAEVEKELAGAMAYSRGRAAEMVESARGHYRFGRSCLTRYFEVLHYGFEGAYQAGLLRFYQLAHQAGELPEVPALRFIDEMVGEGEMR